MFENDEINSRRAYQVAALGAIGVARMLEMPDSNPVDRQSADGDRLNVTSSQIVAHYSESLDTATCILIATERIYQGEDMETFWKSGNGPESPSILSL